MESDTLFHEHIIGSESIVEIPASSRALSRARPPVQHKDSGRASTAYIHSSPLPTLHNDDMTNEARNVASESIFLVCPPMKVGSLENIIIQTEAMSSATKPCSISHMVIECKRSRLAFLYRNAPSRIQGRDFETITTSLACLAPMIHLIRHLLCGGSVPDCETGGVN